MNAVMALTSQPPTVPSTGAAADQDRHLVDPSPSPEQAARRSERSQRVWQAIAQLTQAHREMLVLRDFHDLSYAEIAEVVKIPMGTVMSRLHAARQQLRARLVEKGGLDV